MTGGGAVVSPDAPLAVTAELVELTRGEDELLLADATLFRPLYVREGREYVRRFLRTAVTLKTPGSILRAFPRDAALLESLLSHGILVPEGTKPPAAAPCGCGRLPGGDGEGEGAPCRHSLSLYLLLSQSCNLACAYCLNGRRSYRTGEGAAMDRAVAVRSVETCLAELSPGGCLEVVFFGGEPLLNWETAKATILECEGRIREEWPDRRIRYHVTSNLTVLPPDLPEWSLRYGITFLCDVDGPAEIHDAIRPFRGGQGSHDATAANVRRLADAGIPVDLRATVTARNQGRIPEIARHHREIGGRSSAFVPVSPVNSDEDILGDEWLPSPETILSGLGEVLRRGTWKPEELYPFNIHLPRLRPGSRMTQGCGLPYGNTPVVDARGDASPCIYLVGIDRFRMGNVMDGTFPDRALLRRLHDSLHVDRLEGCRGCSLRHFCGGGCPLWRLSVEGNPRVGERVLSYCREIGCDYAKGLIGILLWDRAEETAARILDGIRGETPVVAPGHMPC